MFGFLRRKPIVERYEEEFKPENMKKRRVYYDVALRVKDPEETRVYAARLLENEGYGISINKLSKFEELEEDIFTGGRLKPIKGVMRGDKYVDFGMKYPLLFGLLLAISLASLIYSYFHNWERSSLIFCLFFAIFAILVSLIKEIVRLTVWIKIAGIYDPSQEKSDIKVTMAGDVSKPIKRAEEKIKEDLENIFRIFSSKYLKEIPEEERYYIIKEGKKPWEEEESKKDEIVKMISLIRKDLAELDSRFARGEISEDAYKEARKRLEERLEKYETVLELFI